MQKMKHLLCANLKNTKSVYLTRSEGFWLFIFSVSYKCIKFIWGVDGKGGIQCGVIIHLSPQECLKSRLLLVVSECFVMNLNN